MSMTRINTNTDALLAGANLRKMEFSISRTMSHLSTGLRIVTGSDDPAGIGLMATFKAQLGGIRMAIQNAEDGLSLMNTADSALADNMDILLRMRDIAVRASSDATLTTSSRQSMQQEYIDLRAELTRRSDAIAFNTKILFSGGLSGKTIQVGPDNTAAYLLTIVIPRLSVTSMNGRNIVSACVSQLLSAQKAISLIQSAINGFASIQTTVGAQAKSLERLVNDLRAEEVNLAAASSRISDADMATEVSEFAKQQIIAQAATAMIAQANANPQSVLKLLGIA